MLDAFVVEELAAIPVVFVEDSFSEFGGDDCLPPEFCTAMEVANAIDETCIARTPFVISG